MRFFILQSLNILSNFAKLHNFVMFTTFSIYEEFENIVKFSQIYQNLSELPILSNFEYGICKYGKCKCLPNLQTFNRLVKIVFTKIVKHWPKCPNLSHLSDFEKCVNKRQICQNINILSKCVNFFKSMKCWQSCQNL